MALKDSQRFFLAMVLTAVVFFSMRFILPSYPSEFSGDEMHELAESVYRSTGDYSFFRYEKNSIGAFGNLFFQILSVFSPAIKTELHLYRIITVLLNGLTILGIYLLARVLFGNTTAILAALSAAMSFWMFFNSRLVITNPLCTLFSVYTLYFLIRGLKGSREFLFFSIIAYILASNTYGNWITLFPVMVYCVFEYMLGKKISMRFGAYLILALTFLTFGLVYFYIANTGMFLRAVNVITSQNSGGIADIFRNFINIGDIFIFGNGHDIWFLPNVPFLSPPESIIFVVSSLIMAANIRQARVRIIFVTAALFILPFFTQLHAHQLRMVQAPAAICIINAVLLRRLYVLKKPLFAAALGLMALAYIMLTAVYFTRWDNTLFRDDVNIKIAKYLNKNFRDPVYLPGFEYNYMENSNRTILRLESTYNSEKKPGEIAFKVNGLWERQVRDYFKEGHADIKIFESTAEGAYRRFPYLLIVLDAETDEAKKFVKYSVVIEEIMKKMRESREEALKLIYSRFSRSKKDIMLNTILKDILSAVYLSENNCVEAEKTCMDLKYHSWITPDFYLKISRCGKISGNEKQAEKYYDLYLRKGGIKEAK